MFPFSRSVTIKHGPVSISFPRLPDLNAHTALILLPRLRGLLYVLGKKTLAGKMKIIIRKRRDGLFMIFRIGSRKFPFKAYPTVDDCIRIAADWVRINPEFIR